MNWLKDNALIILAALCVALGISTTTYALLYKAKKAEFSGVTAKLLTATEASEANAKKAEEMTNKYNELVNKRRLELVEAEKKAKEFEKLKSATQAQLEENRSLRAALARKDPAVKQYLEAGMPHALACQLWPQARECK